MRYLLAALLFAPICSLAQARGISGTFGSAWYPRKEIRLNADSTFEYESIHHPVFYRSESFFEKGIWTLRGDTIFLNPHLPKKNFTEWEFSEEEFTSDTAIELTFNHIKRYIDAEGKVIKADTLQIEQLDYAFNVNKRKNKARVSLRPAYYCIRAWMVPNEIITTKRVITIPRPVDSLQSIFIGCYEMQGTEKFLIKNPNATRFRLNVYSNYYQDGFLRQQKFLIKNDNAIYIRQRPNGKFVKDDAWGMSFDHKLKRMD